MPNFTHLHCHTQFSLLDGAANIDGMMRKAAADGMTACAITDHGNMFGVFQFVAKANEHKIKPIVGCEFYMVKDRHRKTFSKIEKDVRYHQLFLAKNEQGYKNLSKMCSLGWIEGKYGSFPRIDKELVLKYHEGLIATTCCLGAEIPRTILREGEEEAEKLFKWWLDIFGEDYYVELQRHNLPEQIKVNEVLMRFAKKYQVKVIASNDSHYLNQEDAEAHDILLCINTGAKKADPTNKDFSDDDENNQVKKGRFAFSNDQFYFKTSAEMNKMFHDLPEAIDNTNEIADKVTSLKLKKDILLPNFPLPAGFDDQWEYLKHITFEGAIKRYKEITAEIEERLNFELFTIKTMGFAGYFLIVADFIQAGKDIGVFVGPGRGSAAGSAVAYCIGITNIDPIKYLLLFERFLNPDRKSMPDIDTDFDDEGRQKVIDYVVDKYGKSQVAQIITYGTMAAKSSIKDVARVMDLPLDRSNFLAKLVPDKPGVSLKRVFHAPITKEEALKERKDAFLKKTEGKTFTEDELNDIKKDLEKKIKSLSEKENFAIEDVDKVKQIREIYHSGSFEGGILKDAEKLEGSVRSTGVHAAGVIIAPSDLTDLIPVAVAKDSTLYLTQYEGKVIEDAGVIKMDFLGLKTLTIIKNSLALIKKNHGVVFDIDEIDLTDQKTLEIFQKGETNGIFQFENPGLQKFLKELKPDKLEDLIAMTALYRPGPIQYVPTYIKRKNGQEPIVYDLEDMKELLEETYGVTVYQEQVMLLSQKLAGFTKGEADTLRKAMGKKDLPTLEKLNPKFIEGAKAKGHDEKALNKIWSDWRAFAEYAFNKSHATCYAFVAFQTAFLKAHYPAEFLAANLTNEKDNIEKVTYFLEESKRMGIEILGPDVNESSLLFDVNSQGQIRFGLSAIKGMGESAAEAILIERAAGGHYKDVFDFAKRINLRSVTKKAFEALAQSGSFDSFTDLNRAQYFFTEPGENGSYIEKIMRYGGQAAEDTNASQQSLFGAMSMAMAPAKPKAPRCEPWGAIEKLRLEKDLVGFYISGHPLDQYKVEIDNFCTCTIDRLDEFQGKDVTIAGIITKSVVRQTKNGDSFGLFTIEDYSGFHNMVLFKEKYLKAAYMLSPGEFVYIKGKYEVKYNTIDQYEIKPDTIMLLSEMREKMARSLEITVDADMIEELWVDKLEAVLSNHKGKCQFRIRLRDVESNVELFSRKYLIDPNNEMIADLKKVGELSYKLLTK